jgi:nitrogenase molybdenum-iron protein alpha/beta subunit
MTGRRRRDDGGSAIAELVILIVVFFGFIAVVVFAGRITTGRARIEAAARSAARTISIARDPEGAVPSAKRQAEEMAAEGSAICTDMDFRAAIDRGSEPDVVIVDITCIADLSELTLIEVVPGDGVFTASADEVLDVYREDP